MRRRILTLNPSLYDSLRVSNEPVTIAVDSSGVSVPGGWVTCVHGKKKCYIKIHFSVDVKTKEILAMEVTTDDFHDSEVLPALIKDASKLRRVSEAVMDGAYDNSEVYNLLRGMGVKPVIKPRRNARDDRGPPERCRMVRLIEKVGDEGWAGMVGYGRRWAVETMFSTLNASMENTAWRKHGIEKELEAKAYIYNMLINL
ncbi:MAG: transposase [Candidatus Methanomethylicia archaeon]